MLVLKIALFLCIQAYTKVEMTVAQCNLPADCSEVYQMGVKTSGVYVIYPKSRRNKSVSLSVYCDMQTDGGGWTVIQRRGRYSGDSDFDRSWKEYQNGFGILTRNFWLGLENIHILSTQGIYSLRIDMRNSDGVSQFSLHESFHVGAEYTQYMLHVDEYKGNTTNDLQISDKMTFSTKDHPTDGKGSGASCANIYGGAWWYPRGGCGFSNLNAIYLEGIVDVKSNWWYHWTGFRGLQFSEMKIRHRYPYLEEIK